jgi:hypothetical protein
MADAIRRICPFRVNFGLSRPTAATSAPEGEADEIRAKADVPVGMSAVGGGADVACQGLSGPFLARRRHVANSPLGLDIATRRADSPLAVDAIAGSTLPRNRARTNKKTGTKNGAGQRPAASGAE